MFLLEAPALHYLLNMTKRRWESADVAVSVREYDRRSDPSASAGRFSAEASPAALIGVGSRRRSASQAIDLPSDGGNKLGRLFRQHRAIRSETCLRRWRISEYFPIIGQRLDQKAGTLSGGEQKMLIISRALLVEPHLILIDEISEGLQPSVIDRLADILRRERQRTGVSILLVEQNVSFALSVADRYAILKIGEIAAAGLVTGPETAASVHAHLRI
jgi:hypothetical protein